MSIINPTQNQQAIQSLHKWVEKVAVNANTTELDALELVQLQRLLGTLLGTYKTLNKFVAVSSHGFNITDATFGNISLQITPFEDSEDPGTFLIPPITVESWFEHKLSLEVSFVPFEGMTFLDASNYIKDIISSLFPGLVETYKDVQVNKYLESISELPYLFGFTFFIDLDFTTGNHSIDVKYSEGLPKVVIPGVDLVTVTNITTKAADLSSNYLFDDTDSITEVGFEYGTDLEDMTEIASGTTTSPFTASLITLTLDTEYMVVPYVKYGVDKIQRGLVTSFTTLAE